MAKYEQLKAEERHYIQVQRQLGFSITAIAKALNRPKSPISREVQRNTSEAGYCFLAAQKLVQMRHTMKTKVIRWTEEIAWEITDRLLKKWSPEQIVDDLRTKNKPFVSIERIYQFVREDKLAGGKLYLTSVMPQPVMHEEKTSRTKVKSRIVLIFQSDRAWWMINRVSVIGKPIRWSVRGIKDF